MLFYTLGLCVYNCLVYLATLWHPKARALLCGRRGWRDRMRRAFSARQGSVVWFHCASLGEYEQGRSVMEAFMAAHPDWRLLVTFYSPSGYNVRRDDPLATYVGYLPLDTKRNVRDFLSIARPEIVCFVKYEFWPHFLMELARRQVPTFLISAYFRRQQSFFQWYGGFYKRVLHYFSLLFVQDEESRQLLLDFGVSRCFVSGDCRFDRVLATREKNQPYPLVSSLAQGHKVVVFGSTWPSDEQGLLPLLNDLPSGWRAVVVPHELGQARLAALRRGLTCSAVMASEVRSPAELQDVDVLIVDSVGQLFSIYAYASLAYVGGGFGAGIHNTLEPAVYGLPVVFGPRYRDYHEALGLLACGGGQAVLKPAELAPALRTLMDDAERQERMAAAAREFVQSNKGATERTLRNIEPYMHLSR